MHYYRHRMDEMCVCGPRWMKKKINEDDRQLVPGASSCGNALRPQRVHWDCFDRCTTTSVAIESKKIIDKNFDYFCVVHAVARSQAFFSLFSFLPWVLLNTSAIEHCFIMCSLAPHSQWYLFVLFNIISFASMLLHWLATATAAAAGAGGQRDRVLFHWRDMFD